MTDISQAEATALARVLSLAENHSMWMDGSRFSPDFQDETYAAIQAVRAFLKRNGVVTLHEITERLAEGHDVPDYT